MSINMIEMDLDTVDFAKALADDTRQQIMAICCCRLISVSDIVAELNVAQPTVSHHLKILKSAGLVTSERRGKQVLYTLDQARLAAACCQVAEDFEPEYTIEMTV